MKNKSNLILHFLIIIFLSLMLQACGPHLLIKAANYGEIDKVKEHLATNKNDINLEDDNGNTPLIHAAWKGHGDIVRYLIDQGADVNHKDKAGQTALHLACTYGHANIARILIKSGADVNAIKNNGSSPLILATLSNRLDIVKLLLENGADINIQNKRGSTALGYAKTNDYSDIEKFLDSKGATKTTSGGSYATWLQSKSDQDLCLLWTSRKEPAIQALIESKKVNCDTIATHEPTNTAMQNFNCKQPSINGNNQLTADEHKALLYLLNKKYIANKQSEEPVCISNINITDIIKIKGNKIIQHNTTITFPYGYRMRCNRIKEKSERLKRQGVSSWGNFHATMTGGCTPFSSVRDPLGYTALPGDTKNVTGEVEL